ncbi:hypothetical protein ABT330_31580 [Streptomyces sp. NPDC000658]
MRNLDRGPRCRRPELRRPDERLSASAAGEAATAVRPKDAATEGGRL